MKLVDDNFSHRDQTWWSGGLEQPSLITTVFTHEIRVEIPACLGANVGDMIFQSLERLPVLR